MNLNPVISESPRARLLNASKYGRDGSSTACAIKASGSLG